MRKAEMLKRGGLRKTMGGTFGRRDKPYGLVASPRACRASDFLEEIEEEERIAGPRPRKRPRPSKAAAPPAEKAPEPAAPAGKQVVIPESVTVRELASLLGASPIDVIKVLMANGVLANINQPIDFDTAAVVASEMGFEVLEKQPERVAEEPVKEQEVRSVKEDIYAGEPEELLRPRPPVVTVLGHVDHGKTTLLDAIRQTNVAAREVGGITQRIGAYQVEYQGRKITFIDTPGHEAFTAMRARGAQVTDIAVLVVAADDGVMPQTREAIDHARAAKVPIIVALNKIDRPEANPERVKRQLAEIGLTPDDWGGSTLVVPVSALRKQGIEELLAAILLVEEEIRCRANPDAPAAGTVIESYLDRSRGPLATLLVQNGTLHLGDVAVAGTTWGRIRAMFDENGRALRAAPPSTPVQVMGLEDIPPAGTIFRVVPDERTAKEIVASRQQSSGEVLGSRRTVSLEELLARLQSGESKELNVIVKTDYYGSIEPVVSSLERLQDEDRRLNILHAAPGNVTESDVNLALASEGLIIGFNVSVEPAARRLAEVEGVEIRLYNIIYELIEDVEKLLSGMGEPQYEQVDVGEAEVRQVFNLRTGRVAGCYVTSGRLLRNGKVRVVRSGQVIWDGEVASLRRYTEDVREVREGFECGIALAGFDAFEIGDKLVCYEVRRKR
jgi:translation initiation factor IF-2